MRATAEALRAVLLPPDADSAASEADAAVLVLLRARGASLEVLLGLRAHREGDPWSGHVGLPGGRRHPEDASLLATALRETREEVGPDAARQAEVLGRLEARAPANEPAMRVVPFVALARGPIEARASDEMAEVFWAPLEEIAGTRGRTTVDTRIGPLEVPAFLWRGRVIWGFTYRVLEDLLGRTEVTPSAGSAPSAAGPRRGGSRARRRGPGGSARTPRR